MEKVFLPGFVINDQRNSKEIERRSPSYIPNFCKHNHAKKKTTLLSFTQFMKYIVVLGWVFVLHDF